jgi:hypothetical protein
MRTKLLRAVILVTAIAAADGCTEKTRHDPPDPALLAQVVLKHAPTPEHVLDIRFDDKVRLIGYDLAQPLVQPERPFKVTWYWSVQAPLGTGYQVFTHLSDGKINRLNLDTNRALRRAYPEASWKAGDFLKDEQEITLPREWKSDTAIFYLGFYEGSTRLPITQGKQDGEKRAEALRVRVGSASEAEPEPAVPRLVARRIAGPIKIDGKLDEADWRAAQSTGPFVNTMNGDAASFEARAQVLYDADKIYIGFVVADDYLKSTFQHSDDHLWEQDTVEVMFDPDGDAQNYFELQVSPRGVHFDTRYDSPRQPRPFGHVDWDSRVEAKVKLNGTLDDNSNDQGYVVEFAVPFSAFATGQPPVPPPAAGATWRVNFFVMDARKEGQRAAGWSAPRIGDFHTLAKFGRVVFLEGAQPAATATPRTDRK